MIFLKISGGLGNQMFQYATALALAKKLNTKVGIDLSSINDKEDKKDFTYRDFQLDSLFNLDTYEIVPSYTYSFITGNSIIDRVKRKLVGGFYLLEDSLAYQPHIKKCIKNSYIEGYFQSEKYFFDIEDEIKRQFSFTSKLSPKSKILANTIVNTPSIAVHVRRGDYVNNDAINKTHGACDLNYYKTAFSKFNLDDYSIFLFSDDIEWVKEHFTFINTTNSTFIDWNTGKESWQDMYIMSLCQNFIIANSSFSWWGAWLSSHKNKTVIAPKQWFNDKIKNNQTKDLIPESWIRV